MFLALTPILVKIAHSRAESRYSQSDLQLNEKTWRYVTCTLPVRSNPESRVLSCMIAANLCAELQELKRQYESALRIWAQYEFPLHNEPVGTRAQRLEHLRLTQRALGGRNAANDHVLDHKRICPLYAGQDGLRTSQKGMLSQV
jgi:hypothetical protein